MKGIDVSHWNGTLEWPNIKLGGYDFAFIKATESKNYMPPAGIDGLYEQHVGGANGEDLPYGPYHFWRYYGVEGPEGQIDHFLNRVFSVGKPTCKYIVLDAEDKSSPKLTVETKRRLARSLLHLDANLPPEYEVLIYSARWWWDPWIGNDDVLMADGSRVAFAKWPLWVAHYTGNPLVKPYLPLTGSWSDYLFYQYTSTGLIPNAGDDTIDLNYTRLTLDQIRVPAEEPPELTLEERVAALEALHPGGAH
jgi:lysozyme